MGMYPTNTPLDKWLTIWVFHEVERIIDEGVPPELRHQYSGMSPEQRRAQGWPVNRAEAIAFIRKHNPNVDSQL